MKAMKTFAIVNRKGGVAKTTTAIELAYILATNCGKRVLLVDADPQGDATNMLLLQQETYRSGMADLLCGEAYYENVIVHTDISNLDIIPADDSLAELDLEYMTSENRPSFRTLRDLRDSLIEDDAYDFMVIDCPPNYSASCINAILAANSVIIPTNCDKNSAVGMSGLVKQICTLRRQFPDVKFGGCLVTRYRKCDVGEDALEHLKNEAPIHVYDTVIRSTDKVTESSWASQSIQSWSPFSAAARDYRNWVAELLQEEGITV